MSGHTPGPWRECGHSRGGCICGLVWSESADMPVADTALDGDEELRDMRPNAAMRKANARLIASAPELLNALTVLANAAEARGIPVDAARAAIAKATGADA